MTISSKTIKILWSRAAGRCSFPGCAEVLALPECGGAAPHTIGEMAHIKGRNQGANRHDLNLSQDELDSYGNLILLCPNHHTIIDTKENEGRYSVGFLHDSKSQHEAKVEEAFADGQFKTLEAIKDAIATLLYENESVWKQFGPKSEIAKLNPNSDEAYAIWKSERLGTIIPNNRRIVAALSESRDLFSRQDQAVISKFIQHANSYELWVNDDIPYQAVLKFPIEFQNLIMGR